MATPYLGLDNTAITSNKFNLGRMNSNVDKIEKALWTKRADQEDRVQIGADWFTVAKTNKDWEPYTDSISGNKVTRHGLWAMVEIQFESKRAVTVGSSGDFSNTHLFTLNRGYRPTDSIVLSAVNSDLDVGIEFNSNGNGYIVSSNYTSGTIPKGAVFRVAGRYVYVP